MNFDINDFDPTLLGGLEHVLAEGVKIAKWMAEEYPDPDEERQKLEEIDALARDVAIITALTVHRDLFEALALNAVEYFLLQATTELEAEGFEFDGSQSSALKQDILRRKLRGFGSIK